MSNETKGYEKVDSWVEVDALEREVLKFWDESDAFEKLREKNANGEPWSFLDGPITANNPMGVHHAWGRSLKDGFQRYHAMNGRKLRYQNGFDCQGLWVEVEVEKEHGFKSKKEIADFGIDNFVEACKARVRKYSGIQTQQSIRLGMWMDWDNSYFTMSEENNYTIWSFLKKCHERGKIYRGTDVMPWSGRSGSAYSQMEVIEGRKLVAHTAVFVKFPLLDREGENLLIWTTTPWTLTANVAAAVNEELEYVKLRWKKDGEVYYFAKENLEFQRLERQYNEKKEWVDGVPKLKTIAQIFNEQGGYEIEGTVKGADLVGERYQGPFDELEAQQVRGGYPFTDDEINLPAKEAHRVIDGGKDDRGNAIVVAGEGTGIVHTAPGCGDIDHEIGKRLGLPMIAPLDPEARYLPKFGPLAGKRATDHETVEWIIDNLKEKGLLVASEEYPHVYPHCWRTGDELVFRMVDEWYINMDWRDEIIDIVDDIRWIPEYGHDREVEWLTNMRDWMISKKRFWGLALPIWECDSEDCDWFHVIGDREELQERAVDGWEEFDGHTPHRPWVDNITVKCDACGGTAHRIEDVGNPWLDAGIVPYSTMKYNTDREYWETWFPADLVLECFPGQFRNWFYSLLAMSTMMEGKAPFKNLLGHALVRAEDGREMHKSWGNAIWFDEAAERAGADVMRWLYARHDPTVNLNFGYGPLREVRGKFINTLWNSYAFLVNYARLEEWQPGEDTTPFSDRPDFDRWILTELQRTIAECREGIEALDMRRAALAIEEFVEDLSNWYIRHTRRRFWKTDEDPGDSAAAFETLFECLYGVLRLAAPIIPFLTEKMYQNMVRGNLVSAPISVHHTDYPVVDEARVDDDLTDQMRAVKRITSLALSARDAQRLKVRQPLATLEIGPRNDLEARAAKRFEEMLAEDLNVKNVEIQEPGTESPLDYQVKPNFKTLGPRFGKQMKPLAKAIGAQSAAILKQLRADDESIELSLEGDEVSLEPNDLVMVAQEREDVAVAEEQGTWTAFDTTLTHELEIEGLMRDILRRLQMLRKDEGLEIEDHIRLRWDSESDDIIESFENWASYMSDELLADELVRETGLSGEELQIGHDTLVVSVEKV